MARILLLLSILGFGQSLAQTLQPTDSADVLVLLAMGKKQQWINPTKALEYADQALGKAQQIKYNHGIAAAHNLRGFCFWSFGDNDLAIQSAMEGLKYATEINHSLLQADSYYILGRGYMDMNEMSRALEAVTISEKLATGEMSHELVTSILNLKGVVFFLDEKLDSARHYYEKALSYGKAHSVDPIHFPRIISNIGECHLNENRPVALRHFLEALALAQETGNTIANASISAILARFYLQENNTTLSETYLTNALALAKDLGLRRAIRHAYRIMVDLKLKQGKGNEAVEYLHKYYAVRDSLLNTSKMRQIVELEAKHALALKEQNIKILEGENRLQTLQNTILLATVVFTTLGFITLVVWQRYRHKKNREILNLEIDFLTQQHQASIEKIKNTFSAAPTEENLESADQKFLREVISLVETNIGNPSFTVEKMADELSMSRTNLHRKVKGITGFPPNELIRSIRLRKAAKLIVNKVDTASQIATLVGFEDYSHFSKAFKKQFGVPPTNYSGE